MLSLVVGCALALLLMVGVWALWQYRKWRDRAIEMKAALVRVYWAENTTIEVDRIAGEALGAYGK